VSYSDELARKHARDCRTLLESSWYRRTFPGVRINPRKNTETEIATMRHGFRLATSIGGTLTGRGGNIIIIDDPLKPGDATSEAERKRVNEWYDTTLLSRLDDKENGVIILVMQRLHEDDLTGHLIQKKGFELLCLPAIAMEEEQVQLGPGLVHVRRPGEALHPDRESVETLLRLKADAGSLIFSAQYQQAPIPLEGNLFKKSWLKRYAKAPARDWFEQIVISWDTASKVGQGNDYSVGTVWGMKEKEFYLLDVCRGRWDFPSLQKIAITEAETWKANAVLIEDANSGSALIQSLDQDTKLDVIPLKPKLDKVTRAGQQSATVEADRVFVPEEASWLADFERELFGFPNARHDDQVDSFVQFLGWAREHEANQIPLVAPWGLTSPSYWRMGEDYGDRFF
jgi:predicted phage terminase large subunit-like protein